MIEIDGNDSLSIEHKKEIHRPIFHNSTDLSRILSNNNNNNNNNNSNNNNNNNNNNNILLLFSDS